MSSLKYKDHAPRFPPPYKVVGRDIRKHKNSLDKKLEGNTFYLYVICSVYINIGIYKLIVL